MLELNFSFASLYSFAKFLELLLWSPILFSLSLCEHVSPTSISESRLQTLWHFTYKSYKYTFTLESIANSLYEVRFPRLQIISSVVLKEEKHLYESKRKRYEDQERQELNAEIENWWQGLKSRLDKLVGYSAFFWEENDLHCSLRMHFSSRSLNRQQTAKICHLCPCQMMRNQGKKMFQNRESLWRSVLREYGPSLLLRQGSLYGLVCVARKLLHYTHQGRVFPSENHAKC